MKTFTFKYVIQASTLQPVLYSPGIETAQFLSDADSHGLVEISINDTDFEPELSIVVSGENSKERDADIIRVFGSLINNTNRRYYYE